jgi:hypothetical protein
MDAAPLRMGLLAASSFFFSTLLVVHEIARIT